MSHSCIKRTFLFAFLFVATFFYSCSSLISDLEKEEKSKSSEQAKYIGQPSVTISAVSQEDVVVESVEQGTDFVLKAEGVKGENDTGSLKYQWYTNSTASYSAENPGTAISGANKSSYIVKTSEETEVGAHFYYCRVESSLDENAFAISNVLTVVVNEKTPIINAFDIVISGISENFTVSSGKNFTVSVNAYVPEGSGKGTLTYQWYSASSSSDSQGTLISGETNASLTSSYTLTVEDSKTLYYFCVVTNTISDNRDGGNKSTSEVSSVVSVTVNNAINANVPTASSSFQNVTTVIDNIAASYTVSVSASAGTGDGRGNLSYQWYKSQAADVDGQLIAGKTESSLTVERLELASVKTYFYYCIVTNTISDNGDGGQKSASTKAGPYSIDVRAITFAKEPQINRSPVDVIVDGESSEDVVLSVVAVSGAGEGSGILSYQWYSSSSSSAEGIAISGANSASYPVSRSSITKTGSYYYCKVTNTILDYGVQRTATKNTVPVKVSLVSIGNKHPSTGDYSQTNTDTSSPIGATVGSSNTSFVLYSKNATKVLLEIYQNPYGDALPKYDYWMEKDSNDYWRVTVKGNLTGAIYAFRCWGPNWEYSDEWQRGGSSIGFISDCDENGNRFNPNKVVFDPYAKEITHDPSNKDALSHSPSTEKPYNALSTGADFRNYDSGKIAPKGYVISDSTSYGTKPGIPQKDAIIYEAHVRGITKHSSTANLSSLLSGYSQFASVQDIPSEYRGTYKGASYLVPYLKALGINTIELLPVHETDNDANPDDGPGGNFWGYMTFDYFAPDRRYSYDKTPGGPTKEFKEMVKAFHDAGMEVYLDVVYNHSGEGGPWNGKKDNNEQVTIVSMRGIDNSTYYSLVPNDKSAYWETTGCGNNLQCDNPYVRGFILDSLEYWIDEMGVDGFRFDLATVLGREYSSSSSGWDYNLNAATTVKIAELGKAKNVEMIAESWDCGGNSYQVGNFPDGWAGWNGYYRDSIRAFVGNGAERAAISYTDGIYGSLNHFGAEEPSVNFVVAHDGFTLADLCSYSGAGNALNGTLQWPFGPSDGGNGDNNSLGTGTEAASNRQRARNYFAMQMFSAGIPMIVYGDEFGRTQNGNNNPYNIDSVATWNNYSMVATDSPHTVSTGSDGKAECGTYTDKFGTFANTEGKNGNFDFARFVMNERLNNESLRQITGVDAPIEWYSTAGVKGWEDSGCKKAVMINGSGAKNGGTYYMMINMTGYDASFTFPSPSSGKEWTRIVDTGNWAETNCNYWEETDTSYRRDSSGTYSVGPYTVTILKQVADSPVCATPVISGTSPFDTSTQITIECSTEGAKIYYTLNGNIPSQENGTLYTGAFTVTEKTSVKAIAVSDGYKASSVTSKIFYVKGQVSESSKTAVMLQGFNWDSAPRGASTYWYKWYDIMANNGTQIGKTFDYVWFPSPCKTNTASSEGYGPTEWFDFNNCYGTETQLKNAISSISPAKAVADIVVNHREGYSSWGDFANPTLNVVKGSNYKAICSDDEGFTSEPEYMGKVGANMRGAKDTGATYEASRDLDHTNTDVQNGIKEYLSRLKAVGFEGWRYDFVKGFDGLYVGQYNSASSPSFAVGEYWPGTDDGGGYFSASNPSGWENKIKNWISRTQTGGYKTKAFDFVLKGIFNDIFGCSYTGGSNSASNNFSYLASTATLVNSMPEYAVTFVDNHDTGSTQGHWKLPDTAVPASYAYILTHPGYPCVAWQHYFSYAESGNSSNAGSGQYISGNRAGTDGDGNSITLRELIDILIELRKNLAVECDSSIEFLSSSSTCYAAKVTGQNGAFIVTLGTSLYNCSDSDYSLVASGTNYKVWQSGGSSSSKCRTPVITISGGKATITCGTEGAAIKYGFSSGAMNSTYSAPVTMTAGQTIYAYATKDGLEDSGVASKTYTALTTFKATSSATWITDDECVIFAWCWGGGAGEGAWYEGTSDSSGGFTWEAPGDITHFKLARCIKGTTVPDWKNKSDTPGRIYNQTADYQTESGVTQYSVSWD